jgi:hypothetical protein
LIYQRLITIAVSDDSLDLGDNTVIPNGKIKGNFIVKHELQPGSLIEKH